MPGAAANQGTSRLAIRADRAFGGREMIPGGHWSCVPAARSRESSDARRVAVDAGDVRDALAQLAGQHARPGAHVQRVARTGGQLAKQHRVVVNVVVPALRHAGPAWAESDPVSGRARCASPGGGGVRSRCQSPKRRMVWVISGLMVGEIVGIDPVPVPGERVDGSGDVAPFQKKIYSLNCSALSAILYRPGFVLTVPPGGSSTDKQNRAS